MNTDTLPPATKNLMRAAWRNKTDFAAQRLLDSIEADPIGPRGNGRATMSNAAWLPGGAMVSCQKTKHGGPYPVEVGLASEAGRDPDAYRVARQLSLRGEVRLHRAHAIYVLLRGRVVERRGVVGPKGRLP